MLTTKKDLIAAIIAGNADATADAFIELAQRGIAFGDRAASAAIASPGDEGAKAALKILDEIPPSDFGLYYLSTEVYAHLVNRHNDSRAAKSARPWTASRLVLPDEVVTHAGRAWKSKGWSVQDPPEAGEWWECVGNAGGA